MTTTKTRTTKERTAKTIYRDCECGENAHDGGADNESGEWVQFYACRNCRTRIMIEG